MTNGIYSQIHQRWFFTEEKAHDMIVQVDLCTTMTELNNVMRKGLDEMKKETKL